MQLTSHEAGTPQWSPDGKQIVYASVESGNKDLYVIDADGGKPRRLTQEPTNEDTPSWSRDGRWIYFHRDLRRIWKIPADGGSSVPLTQGRGAWPQESWDGRFVYFVRDEMSLWRVSITDGQETEVVPKMTGNWSLARDGLYFMSKRPILPVRTEEFTLSYLDFSSGDVTDLFSKVGAFDHIWLAVSPDEEWILYPEQESPTSELMLVESFR